MSRPSRSFVPVLGALVLACATERPAFEPHVGPIPPALRSSAPRSATHSELDRPPGALTAVTIRPDSLARRLDATRVPSYRLAGAATLREALEPLRAAAGLPIVVTREAEEAASGLPLALDLPNPMRARRLLDLIVELAGDDVGWSIRHDVVWVTTKAKARGPLVLRSYDIGALITPLTSFRGPDIGRIAISGADDDEERFGGVESSEPRFDPDEIETLVRDHVAPESWDVAGASLSIHGRQLFVRNSPEVQLEVLALLAGLGAF